MVARAFDTSLRRGILDPFFQGMADSGWEPIADWSRLKFLGCGYT
jgi:hypothetical protein